MDFDSAQWDKQQAKRQASFLQSAHWGNFQLKVGSAPHYLMEDGWSCLLLERRTPLGKYLFAPYGPTLQSADQLETAITGIKDYAGHAGFDWVSIEPMQAGGSAGLKPQLTKLGAKKAAHNREPDMTRLLGLTPPADELLAAVSQSTRSFIRKNQREKFLTFKTSTDPGDIPHFTKMLSQVSDRKNVHFFSDDYFKKQAAELMPPGMMYLEIAYENGQPIASALFHDFGQKTTYTFAASLPQARRTSASALLLWQGLQNAKQRRMKIADLYGIAPDDAGPEHPWAGFSSFKRKFGGHIEEYAGTWDIPLSGRYRLYRRVHSARKLLRRR